jgi:hypothetical protein
MNPAPATDKPISGPPDHDANAHADADAAGTWADAHDKDDKDVAGEKSESVQEAGVVEAVSSVP